MANEHKTFFAAYYGLSMKPTLRAPGLMEVVPYSNQPVKTGDVIFFIPPGSLATVVHRVIRINPLGIHTCGDNNPLEDGWILQNGNIAGRVTAIWYGSRQCKVPGGWRGSLTAFWHQRRRSLYHRLSGVLTPLYNRINRPGLLARVIPMPFRPRLIVFLVNGRKQFYLMWGGRTIGQYDEKRSRWNIRWPYRIFVDRRLLAEQPFRALIT